MTALQEYDRLEASGLWRAGPDQQRRDVIVSIGDATLVISDTNDIALTHWSLPAVKRANPGMTPAIFSPDGDPSETLELAENETNMVAAIEKLCAAIEKSRPHPGRLRFYSLLLSVVAVLLTALFWLPGALLDHTVSVVPAAKRQAIGATLLGHTRRLTGPPCSGVIADPALAKLAAKFDIHDLQVVRQGVRETLALPGGILLLNRALIEDHEGPDVAAGYILAALQRNQALDPLEHFLDTAGLRASFRLLTTGGISETDARGFAEDAVAALPSAVADQDLLRGFATYGVGSTAYGFAVDVSGETTLALIEGDPFSGRETQAILSDGEWVALQGICENG